MPQSKPQTRQPSRAARSTLQPPCALNGIACLDDGGVHHPHEFSGRLSAMWVHHLGPLRLPLRRREQGEEQSSEQDASEQGEGVQLMHRWGLSISPKGCGPRKAGLDAPPPSGMAWPDMLVFRCPMHTTSEAKLGSPDRGDVATEEPLAQEPQDGGETDPGGAHNPSSTNAMVSCVFRQKRAEPSSEGPLRAPSALLDSPA